MLGIVTIVSNAVDDLYLYQKSKNTSIREKIEINPKEPRYLKVVWGVGYKIEKHG